MTAADPVLRVPLKDLSPEYVGTELAVFHKHADCDHFGGLSDYEDIPLLAAPPRRRARRAALHRRRRRRRHVRGRAPHQPDPDRARGPRRLTQEVTHAHVRPPRRSPARRGT